MESIGTGHAQDMDNEPSHSQVMADCLRNAIVVRIILENFTNPELLKLSWLNKLWNYEARSVMTVRGNIIASLGRSGLCHDIQAFAESLRQINIVPFSGMRILFPANDDSCRCATSTLDPTHDIPFDALPFKTLSVQLVGKRWDNQNCRGFLLTEQILQDVSSVIEELSIQMCSNPESFLQHNFQECCFPRLKILKLTETHSCTLTYEDYVNYFKVFISRAPNLRELHSDGSIRELLDIVKGSTVVPVCSNRFLVAFDQTPDNTITRLLKVRLQKMELVCTTGRNFNFDRFNRIFPMLLQASCFSTVCELTVDALIAVSLMRYGVCLENVRKLTMGFDLDHLGFFDSRSIVRFLAHFNATRIFLKLSKVYISSQSYLKGFPISMKTFIRQENANLRGTMPNHGVTINELHLDWRAAVSNSTTMFAQMFPNIDRLYVEGSGEAARFMLESIFQHWTNFRELHIKSDYLEDNANFDCTFCGIFLDEVVELRQKDEEYLKRVHIVPVWPAITFMTNLRVLNLEYDLRCRPYPLIYDATSPTFFLSKVTGLVALARCPNLAVTLKISPVGPQEVSHLKPYLSIVQLE